MRTIFNSIEYKLGVPVCAMVRYNDNFPVHWHPEIEMVYVCDGSIEIAVDRYKRIVKEGELVFINSCDSHSYNSHEMNSKIIVIIFNPDLIGISEVHFERKRFNPFYIQNDQLKRLDKKAKDNIYGMFQSIAHEFKEKQPFYIPFIRAKTIELYTMALRYFSIDAANENGPLKRISEFVKVKKAMEFLENNYMEDISLDIVAEKVNMSPCYLSRVFKTFFGTNYKSYLNTLRCDKAEYMIRSSTKKIIDIAMENGFNSIRTFNRVFKSVKGYLPSSLRYN